MPLQIAGVREDLGADPRVTPPPAPQGPALVPHGVSRPSPPRGAWQRGLCGSGDPCAAPGERSGRPDSFFSSDSQEDRGQEGAGGGSSASFFSRSALPPGGRSFPAGARRPQVWPRSGVRQPWPSAPRLLSEWLGARVPHSTCTFPVGVGPALAPGRLGHRCPGPRYLHTVFTFEALAAVVGHLVADEVGLPVEGLGALVTLVLTLLRVDSHVLLQAEHSGRGSPWGPLPAAQEGRASTQPGCSPLEPPAPRRLPAQRAEQSLLDRLSTSSLDGVAGWRDRHGLMGGSRARPGLSLTQGPLPLASRGRRDPSSHSGCPSGPPSP